MAQDFSSYLKALQDFYSEAAWWNYAKQTNDKEEEISRLKVMKEKAQILESELKKLPSDMVRSGVQDHINKALSL